MFQVTLDCKDKDDNPTTVQKKVQIITNCSCSSCTEFSRIKPDFNSLLQSLEQEAARVGHHHTHLHHQAPSPPPADSSGGGGGFPTSGDNATETTSAAAPAAEAPAASIEDQQQQSAPAPAASAAETQPTGPNGASQETPDLLLNPNLSNGSGKGSVGSGAIGSAKANERFLQLLKQLNDPALGADKLEKLAKLDSLEKLEKLEKLGRWRKS